MQRFFCVYVFNTERLTETTLKEEREQLFPYEVTDAYLNYRRVLRLTKHRFVTHSKLISWKRSETRL